MKSPYRVEIFVFFAGLIIAAIVGGCANRQDPTMSGVMTVQEVGAIMVLDEEFRK